ncbi:MAG: helix-turn-helix domain-containing protein [Nitrososphaerales archaeon]
MIAKSSAKFDTSQTIGTSSRSSSEAHDMLVSLGFDSIDAEIFLNLLQSQMTVKQISDGSDLSRVEIYRSINRLQGQGFLTIIGTNPRKYAAVPMDQTIGILHSRWSQRLQLLTKYEAVMKDEVRGKRTFFGNSNSTQGYFSVLRGRKAILSKIIEKIRTCDQMIEIVTEPKELAILETSGILEAIEERSSLASQISIRILCAGDDSVSSRLEPPIFVRKLRSQTLIRVIIFDAKECLIGSSLGIDLSMGNQNDLAIWTDNPAIVSLCSQFFKMQWERSDFLLDAQSKKQLDSFSKILSSNQDCLKAARGLIGSAKKLLILLNDEDLESVGIQIKEEIHGAIERGVQFELECQSSPSIVHHILGNLDDAKVKQIERPSFSAIVSDAQCLLVLRSSKSGISECLVTDQEGFNSAIRSYAERISKEPSKEADERHVNETIAQILLNETRHNIKEIKKIGQQVFEEIESLRAIAETSGAMKLRLEQIENELSDICSAPEK